MKKIKIILLLLFSLLQQNASTIITHGELKNRRSNYIKGYIKNILYYIKKCEYKYPLHNSITNNDLKYFIWLLKHGANINEKDDFGGTPSHHAAYYGYTEYLNILLKHGANVNEKDNYRWTPLHHAADEEYLECIKVLLQHDANVNEKDNDGWTPLHHATDGEHLECIKVLLEYDANPLITNNKNKLPIDYTKNSDIKKLLQKVMKQYLVFQNDLENKLDPKSDKERNYKNAGIGKKLSKNYNFPIPLLESRFTN